jgi:hypothetical protein
MNARFSRNLIILLAVAAVAVAYAPGQTVLLKPKFTPGSVAYVETKQDIKQDMSGAPLPGGSATMNMNQIFGLLEKVEAAGKNVHLVQTFDRVSMRMESSAAPGMGGDYDSDRPENDESGMLGQIFPPMVGGVLTIEIDPDGKVVSAKGMQKIIEKIEESGGGNPMFAQMKESMTDDSTKTEWQTRLAFFPNKEVKVGETWTKTVKSPMPTIGELQVEFNCKLEKVEKKDGHDLAIIAYTTKTTQPADAKAEEGMGGMKFAVEGGTGKGTVTFDAQRGEIVKRVQDSTLKLRLQMPGAAEDADSPGMKISVDSKETLTLMTEQERKAQKAENAKKKAAKEPAAGDAGKKTEKKGRAQGRSQARGGQEARGQGRD